MKNETMVTEIQIQTQKQCLGKAMGDRVGWEEARAPPKFHTSPKNCKIAEKNINTVYQNPNTV